MEVIRQLKEHTRASHARLDTHPRISKLVCGRCTLEEYAYFLGRWYGFLVPIEKHVFPVLEPLDPVLQLENRRRSHWIVDDLKHIGVRERDIERIGLATLPIVRPDISQALGILYVTEGSTLGGAFLLRRIRELFSFLPGAGGSFFYGYGSQRMRMWEEFRIAINKELITARARAKALESAERTFDHFEKWLSAETAHANEIQNV